MLRFPPDAQMSGRSSVLHRVEDEDNDMKLLGLLLLLAGWGIVLAALALLSKERARSAFVCAGLGVEVTGIVLVVRAHPAPRGFED